MDQQQPTDAQGNTYVRCISQEFSTHLLNEQGKTKARQIAEDFDNLLRYLHITCFGQKDSNKEGWEGREWALVKTKLEEACFYAKKAMAKLPENQQNQ